MTKENAHEFLPIVQALADGKDLELFDQGKWISLKNLVYFNRSADEYRIKPEPVMVPLGPEDVEIGDLLRSKARPAYRYMICSVTETVGTDGDDIGWNRLRDEYEIKRPGESWKPCSKPAPES